MKKKRRKPVEERLTVEVDGMPRRLAWVAENCPEVLARMLVIGKTCTGWRFDSYLSALAKAGWTREKIAERCVEWGIDPGVFGQL